MKLAGPSHPLNEMNKDYLTMGFLIHKHYYLARYDAV
jgi:hypothetical protein